MKHWFAKLFLLVVFCMFLGAAVLLLGMQFGRIGIQDVVSAITYVYEWQAGGIPVPEILAGIVLAAALGALTWALFIRSNPRAITYQQNGAFLSVPMDTIKSFVTQELAAQPLLMAFDTDIRAKGKRLKIAIYAAFNSFDSVCRQATEVKEALGREIDRVLELPFYEIQVQIREIVPSATQQSNQSSQANKGVTNLASIRNIDNVAQRNSGFVSSVDASPVQTSEEAMSVIMPWKKFQRAS